MENSKHTVFPQIKERKTPHWVTFLVAYFAGIASILTREGWPMICAGCLTAAAFIGSEGHAIVAMLAKFFNHHQ